MTWIRLSVTVALGALLLAVPVSAQEFSRQVPPSPGTPVVSFDTVDGLVDSAPTRFRTGTIDGTFTYVNSSDVIHVALTGLSKTARVTYRPTINDPSQPSIDLRFGSSRIAWVRDENDEMTIVLDTLPSCADLASDLDFIAIRDHADDFLVGLRSSIVDVDDLDDDEINALLIFTHALRAFAGLPAMVECGSGTTDPLYGVCGIHTNFDSCNDCCAGDETADGFINQAAGYCARRIPGPIGWACRGVQALTFIDDQCEFRNCSGKRGDPAPINCANPGQCMAWCQGGSPAGGGCPEPLVCCTPPVNGGGPF